MHIYGDMWQWIVDHSNTLSTFFLVLFSGFSAIAAGIAAWAANKSASVAQKSVKVSQDTAYQSQRAKIIGWLVYERGQWQEYGDVYLELTNLGGIAKTISLKDIEPFDETLFGNLVNHPVARRPITYMKQGDIHRIKTSKYSAGRPVFVEFAANLMSSHSAEMTQEEWEDRRRSAPQFEFQLHISYTDWASGNIIDDRILLHFDQKLDTTSYEVRRNAI